ncbi:MAG: hypothetical protein FJ225_13625 [Lentisphaerae bacterium]|nr:hypothetical protein [Lentisphaerota bacterium]
MRRTFLAAAGVMALAGLARGEDLTAGLTMGWESEYVFRGRQPAGGIFTPLAEIGCGGAYADIRAAVGTGEAYSEIDYTAGYGLQWAQALSADAGLTFYTYPDKDGGVLGGEDNTLEAFAGLAAELAAKPELYVAYDFQLRNVAAELKLSHARPLADRLAVETAATAGHVWIGLEENFIEPPAGESGAAGRPGAAAYWYCGLTLDLRLDMTDGLSLRVGGRVNASSAPGLYDGADYSAWYGVSLAYSYGA